MPKSKKKVKVDHGEIVSFIPSGYSVEVQGRIMQEYTDEGQLCYTVAMLIRPENPRDYVDKSNKIYEYFETDEYVEIYHDQILQVIPSEVLFENEDDYEYMDIHINEKLLQKGFIYITQFEDSSKELHRPTVPYHTVWAYHFHPDNKQFIGMETDIATAYYGFIKYAIFDPFISAAAKVTRSKQKNLELWQLLLNMAPIENFVWDDFYMQCLKHPLAVEKAKVQKDNTISLLDVQPMLAARDCIPFILEKLTKLHHLYQELPDGRLHATAGTALLTEWSKEVDANLRKWNSRGVYKNTEDLLKIIEEEKKTGEDAPAENEEEEEEDLEDLICNKIIKMDKTEDDTPMKDEEIIDSDSDETESTESESVDFRRRKDSDDESTSSSDADFDGEEEEEEEEDGEEEEEEESSDESSESSASETPKKKSKKRKLAEVIESDSSSTDALEDEEPKQMLKKKPFIGKFHTTTLKTPQVTFVSPKTEPVTTPVQPPPIFSVLSILNPTELPKETEPETTVSYEVITPQLQDPTSPEIIVIDDD